MLFTKQLPCSCETYILVGDKETKHLSEQQSVGLGNVEVWGGGWMGNRNFFRSNVDWAEMASVIGNVCAQTGSERAIPAAVWGGALEFGGSAG